MSDEWDDDEPMRRRQPVVAHRRAPPEPPPPPTRPPPSEGGTMEQIAGQSLAFVRGVGKDHGPVVALLFVTLGMVFVLLFAVTYFVGLPIKASIENNVASTKAMMAVVDQMEDQCRAPRTQWMPQQWPQQQPRQWPQPPSQQPGFQNGSQQTPR